MITDGTAFLPMARLRELGVTVLRSSRVAVGALNVRPTTPGHVGLLAELRHTRDPSRSGAIG